MRKNYVYGSVIPDGHTERVYFNRKYENVLTGEKVTVDVYTDNTVKWYFNDYSESPWGQISRDDEE